ncbi:MAG: hypothetical protein R2827_15245 [Bdellovibrionales bacterium]
MSTRRGVARILHLLISLVSVSLLVGCTDINEQHKAKAKISSSWPIMENLFDLDHTYEDEHKNDWQYLPIGYPQKMEGCLEVNSRNGVVNEKYYNYCITTDWNREKLNKKLESIEQVVMTPVDYLTYWESQKLKVIVWLKI